VNFQIPPKVYCSSPDNTLNREVRGEGGRPGEVSHIDRRRGSPFKSLRAQFPTASPCSRTQLLFPQSPGDPAPPTHPYSQNPDGVYYHGNYKINVITSKVLLRMGDEAVVL
jgi:hypothetical protein